jgi:hypothetical protein
LPARASPEEPGKGQREVNVTREIGLPINTASDGDLLSDGGLGFRDAWWSDDTADVAGASFGTETGRPGREDERAAESAF